MCRGMEYGGARRFELVLRREVLEQVEVPSGRRYLRGVAGGGRMTAAARAKMRRREPKRVAVWIMMPMSLIVGCVVEADKA